MVASTWCCSSHVVNKMKCALINYADNKFKQTVSEFEIAINDQQGSEKVTITVLLMMSLERKSNNLKMSL